MISISVSVVVVYSIKMSRFFNFFAFLALLGLVSLAGSSPSAVDDSVPLPYPEIISEIQEMPTNYINIDSENQTVNPESTSTSTTEETTTSTTGNPEISTDIELKPEIIKKIDSKVPLKINKPDEINEIQDFLGQKSRFCPQVMCSPPPNPNYASCELSAEGTTYNIMSPVLGDLSYCCPIWICIRKDGSMFTHYGVSQDSDIKDKIKIEAQSGTIGEKGHYAALKSSNPTFGFPKLFNFSPNYDNFIKVPVDSDSVTTSTTTRTTTTPKTTTTTEASTTSLPEIILQNIAVASQTIPEIPVKPTGNVENLPIIPITAQNPNQFYQVPIPVQYIFALPPVVNYDPIPNILWPNPNSQQQSIYDLLNLKSRTFLNNYPQQGQQQIYNNLQHYNPYLQQQGSNSYQQQNQEQQQPSYNIPLNNNYQPLSYFQNLNQQQFQDPQQQDYNYY